MVAVPPAKPSLGNVRESLSEPLLKTMG